MWIQCSYWQVMFECDSIRKSWAVLIEHFHVTSSPSRLWRKTGNSRRVSVITFSTWLLQFAVQLSNEVYPSALPAFHQEEPFVRSGTIQCMIKEIILGFIVSNYRVWIHWSWICHIMQTPLYCKLTLMTIWVMYKDCFPHNIFLVTKTQITYVSTTSGCP